MAAAAIVTVGQACSHRRPCCRPLICRTDNLFHSLEQRTLTEEEQKIIEQRVGGSPRQAPPLPAWLQLSLDGKEGPAMDGITADQRFFMGWAQVWRRKYRDENLLTRLKTDPHSPSEYRCNGVVVNMPAFADAFMVKEGDKLYKAPEQRIKIW